MRYMGGAAYQLDAQQSWEVPVGRQLKVHRGGGLDAQRARQSSPATLVVAFVALTVVLALVGCVRIFLTTATVSTLKEVSVAEQVVEGERVTRAQLQMEHSALTAADRIQRIATENYGMVYASDIDTVTLDLSATSEADGSEEVDAEAFAEDAQPADDADAGAPVA